MLIIGETGHGIQGKSMYLFNFSIRQEKISLKNTSPSKHKDMRINKCQVKEKKKMVDS